MTKLKIKLHLQYHKNLHTAKKSKSSSDTSVTKIPPATTFHLRKSLHDRSLETDLSDDVTVSNGNSTNYLTQRLSLMLSIPGKEKGIDNDEALLEAIRQMNAMLCSLVNKVLTVKFGPWSGCPIKRINYSQNFQKT